MKDGGITSASNESSVVLYGSFGDQRALLTGDAGVNGLNWAANYAEAVGLPLQQFTFVQIPHHGSRSNVGPAILTRLLGEKQPQGSASRFAAIVSAPKNSEKHPRLMVLNAFKRRGGRVSATQGSNVVHWGGFPERAGYSIAKELPFYEKVEAYT